MTTGKKKVLLVEDDEAIRTLLHLSIGRLGAEVYEAGDGLSALGVAAHITPDVIVTDLSMPHFDGVQLIKEIRAGHVPKLRAVPILCISGASEDTKKRAVEAGATIVLSKPKFRKPLIEALEKFLKEE